MPPRPISFFNNDPAYRDIVSALSTPPMPPLVVPKHKPRMRSMEAALAEFARTGVMPGPVQSQYDRDPRRSMVDAMMQRAQDTSPVQSVWEGVARLGQGVLAGYEIGRAHV